MKRFPGRFVWWPFAVAYALMVLFYFPHFVIHPAYENILVAALAFLEVLSVYLYGWKTAGLLAIVAPTYRWYQGFLAGAMVPFYALGSLLMLFVLLSLEGRPFLALPLGALLNILARGLGTLIMLFFFKGLGWWEATRYVGIRQIWPLAMAFLGSAAAYVVYTRTPPRKNAM